MRWRLLPQSPSRDLLYNPSYVEEVARLGRTENVAFDRDGHRLVAIPTASEVRVLRIPDADVAASARFRYGINVTASPECSRFVVLNTRGGGLIIDGRSFEELARTSGVGIGEGPAAVFGPDEDAYVQASWDGDLLVRDSTTGEVLYRERNREEMIHSLTRDPSGGLFAYAVSRDVGETSILYARRWPFDENEPLEVLRFETPAEQIDEVALRDEHTVAAIVSYDLRVYSVPGGDLLAERQGGFPMLDGLAWSPSGDDLAFIDRRGGDHRVILASSELHETDSVELPWPRCVAFSLDGAFLAVGSSESARIFRRLPASA